MNMVAFGLLYLFREPEPKDPLNSHAAQLMINNREKFIENVKTSLQGGIVDNINYSCYKFLDNKINSDEEDISSIIQTSGPSKRAKK